MHTKLNELLAAAADPNSIERGGRPYWLLRARSKAFKTRVGYKGIRKGTLVVKAQWYDATSPDNSRRRSYKILPETVHVAVRSMIQEQQLEFMRGGSESGDCCLSDETHARLMCHNYENYD